MKRPILLLLTIFQFACANIPMHGGEGIAASNISIIKPGTASLFSFDPELAIIKINGKPVPKSVTWDVPSYEVISGEQTITSAQYYPTNTATFVTRDKARDRTIRFHAEAGKTYIVFYTWRNRDMSDWELYVKDESNNEIVAKE